MPCLQFQVTKRKQCPKSFQVSLTMLEEFSNFISNAWSFQISLTLLGEFPVPFGFPRYSQPVCIAQLIFKSYWQCLESFQVLLMMPRQIPSPIVTDGGVFLTHWHSPHYLQIPWQYLESIQLQLALPRELLRRIGKCKRVSKSVLNWQFLKM
jgi:hypothetical protein